MLSHLLINLFPVHPPRLEHQLTGPGWFWEHTAGGPGGRSGQRPWNATVRSMELPGAPALGLVDPGGRLLSQGWALVRWVPPEPICWFLGEAEGGVSPSPW